MPNPIPLTIAITPDGAVLVLEFPVDFVVARFQFARDFIGLTTEPGLYRVEVVPSGSGFEVRSYEEITLRPSGRVEYPLARID